jgi:hypothetical protein
VGVDGRLEAVVDAMLVRLRFLPSILLDPPLRVEKKRPHAQPTSSLDIIQKNKQKIREYITAAHTTITLHVGDRWGGMWHWIIWLRRY